MSAKVLTLPVITTLDCDPVRILRRTADLNELDGVVVLGFTKNGEEYFASSYADAGHTLYLMERCKHMLMKIIDNMTE